MHNCEYGVVAVLVEENVAKQISLLILHQEHIKHHLLTLKIYGLYQIFHNTWWVFRCAILKQILLNNPTYFIIYCLVFKIYDLTYDIVGKFIIYEFFHIFYNFVNKLSLLLHTASFETCLHNTTALFVFRNFMIVLDDCFVNWVFMLIFWKNV